MDLIRGTDSTGDSATGDGPCRVLMLAPDVVHVVGFALDSDVPSSMVQLLDDSERHRASRFVFDRDRRRFINAHGFLRLLLGHCLNRAPESIRYALGTHGKPRVVDPPVDVRFNLSHAGERALVAVALGRELGVDIEAESAIDIDQIAGRFFAPREVAALNRLPASQRQAAFFRCWTRKEAFIKAVGEGLSFPLHEFEVSLAGGESHQLLRGCERDPEALLRWRLVSLPTERQHAAALAVERDDWRPVFWHGVVRDGHHLTAAFARAPT